MFRRLDVFTPETSSEGREESAMIGDETVCAFRGSRENGRMGIPVEKPLFVRIAGECPESGFSAGVNCSAWLDEMDSDFQLRERNFGKPLWNGAILEGEIVEAIAGDVLPT